MNTKLKIFRCVKCDSTQYGTALSEMIMITVSTIWYDDAVMR